MEGLRYSHLITSYTFAVQGWHSINEAIF